MKRLFALLLLLITSFGGLSLLPQSVMGEIPQDYIVRGKKYKKLIPIYSDNILAFEKYCKKYEMWQMPVIIAKDGITVYMENPESRGVYYYDDFALSHSRKFIFMCQYYPTPDISAPEGLETNDEIIRFRRGIIMDTQTGGVVLHLLWSDVTGEWNCNDEWVSDDHRVIFSPTQNNEPNPMVSGPEVFLTEALTAKPLGTETSERSMGLIDNDNVVDSIYYNYRNQALIVLLSSREFEPISFEWELWEGESFMAGHGGMSFWNNTMRTNGGYSYRFEDAFGKFRLSKVQEEYHGPDGYISFHHDLLTHTYILDYYHFGLPYVDSLISIEHTPMEIKIYNPPIYLGSDQDYRQPNLDSIKQVRIDAITNLYRTREQEKFKHE